MATIELMALTFNKETISNKKVFGFKINENFKHILSEIHKEAGERYAGRKIFQIANALQQTEIIHCHGDLKTISENNDVWFYSSETFNPKLLFTFISKWIAEELKNYGLNFELNNSIGFFGEFVELSWADLLGKECYKNGKKALEKLVLSLLEDKYFEFLDGDACALALHRVINDSDSMLMSQPCFPNKSSAYSYTLRTQIEEVQKEDSYMVSFAPSMRLWIQESPLTSGDYFKTRDTTNAYITTPGLLSSAKKIVFNQISLRKNGKGIYSHKVAHDSFLKTTNIDVQELLKEELSFDPKSTNILVTMPNDCRTRSQKVSNKNINTTTFGIGLSEREKIFYFAKKELMKHGFEEVLPLDKCSGDLSFKKVGSFDKIDTFKEYGVLDFVDVEEIIAKYEEKIAEWIAEGKKNTEPKRGGVFLNEEPFVCFSDKKKFKIAVFSPDESMQRILIATTRMLLHAKEEVKELSYRNKDGVEIEFLIFNDNITNEISKTSESNARMRQIEKLIKGKGINAAFIEIGDLKGSKGDPKKPLRTMFSSFGVKTQFIHPLEEESPKVGLLQVKAEVINRSMSASHDLLSKLGFVDIKTKKYFEENNSYTAVTRVRFFNQLFVPVIIKNCKDGAKIKIYPESEWIEFDDLEAKINARYIQQNEEDWKRIAYGERSLRHQSWLKTELTKIKQEDKETRVVWDVRVDALLDYKQDSFDVFIDEVLNLKGLTILRYEYTKNYMGYLARNGKGKLGKHKGIFKPDFYENKWILIGQRINNQAKVAWTKWDKPTKSLIAPSLCEVAVHSKEETNQFNEVRDLQYLRMANITFDVETAYPYPMSLARYIEELVEAFYDCHSEQSQKEKKEDNKILKGVK